MRDKLKQCSVVTWTSSPASVLSGGDASVLVSASMGSPVHDQRQHRRRVVMKVQDREDVEALFLPDSP